MTLYADLNGTVPLHPSVQNINSQNEFDKYTREITSTFWGANYMYTHMERIYACKMPSCNGMVKQEKRWLFTI